MNVSNKWRTNLYYRLLISFVAFLHRYCKCLLNVRYFFLISFLNHYVRTLKNYFISSFPRFHSRVDHIFPKWSFSLCDGGENESRRGGMASKIMCKNNKIFSPASAHDFYASVVAYKNYRDPSREDNGEPGASYITYFVFPFNSDGITHIRLLCMFSNFLDANLHPLGCNASLGETKCGACMRKNSRPVNQETSSETSTNKSKSRGIKNPMTLVVKLRS